MKLREAADVVLIFATERLSRIPEAQHNVREGFRAMNRILGDTAQSVSTLLATRALMQLSMADMQTLAGRRHHGPGVLENCWVSVATASGIDRQKRVVEKALGGPLFSDAHVWKNGDRILASVVGGPEMSVTDFQKVMQILQRELPVEFPLVAGAAVDEALEDRLMLTLLVARSADGEVPAEEFVEENESIMATAVADAPVLVKTRGPVAAVLPARKKVLEEAPPVVEAAQSLGEEEESKPRSRRGRDRGKETKEQRYFSEQEELPLDNKVLRGRFEKAVPTMFNGQNLDQPTFMRLKMRLRISPGS
jgi:cell division protein FtsZ